MECCIDGDFAGVYTCMRNEVNLEQKDKSFSEYTGLMHASWRGYKSIVDLHLDFQVDVNV